jgi:hypothetical protein
VWEDRMNYLFQYAEKSYRNKCQTNLNNITEIIKNDFMITKNSENENQYEKLMKEVN